MDAVFWGPNWSWSSDEELFAKLKNELSGDTWILDGNYTQTIPIKWENVQMVIWLDYPFQRTVFQAIKRTVQRSLTQEELWTDTGNKESFRKSFLSKDSIILWTIKTYRKVREKYEITKGSRGIPEKESSKASETIAPHQIGAVQTKPLTHRALEQPYRLAARSNPAAHSGVPGAMT